VPSNQPLLGIPVENEQTIDEKSIISFLSVRVCTLTLIYDIIDFSSIVCSFSTGIPSSG
jgi:hypothetical protein